MYSMVTGQVASKNLPGAMTSLPWPADTSRSKLSLGCHADGSSHVVGLAPWKPRGACRHTATGSFEHSLWGASSFAIATMIGRYHWQLRQQERHCGLRLPAGLLCESASCRCLAGARCWKVARQQATGDQCDSDIVGVGKSGGLIPPFDATRDALLDVRDRLSPKSDNKAEVLEALELSGKLLEWMINMTPQWSRIHTSALNLRNNIVDMANCGLQRQRETGHTKVLKRVQWYLQKSEELGESVTAAEKDNFKKDGALQQIRTAMVAVMKKYSGAKEVDSLLKQLFDADEAVIERKRDASKAAEKESDCRERLHSAKREKEAWSKVVAACEHRCDTWSAREAAHGRNFDKNLRTYSQMEDSSGVIDRMQRFACGGGADDKRREVDRSQEAKQAVQDERNSAEDSFTSASGELAQRVGKVEGLECLAARVEQDREDAVKALKEAEEKKDELNRQADEMLEGHGSLGLQTLGELRASFNVLYRAMNKDGGIHASFFETIKSFAAETEQRLKELEEDPEATYLLTELVDKSKSALKQLPAPAESDCR
mmetsp:Transcript_30065/g.70079  ORF Transcript_30065/g.70079 Transcript_30065/m.70079 type:complete len:544 (+) Transcript_30065:97-1728(+)